jgi:hypothetical protein
MRERRSRSAPPGGCAACCTIDRGPCGEDVKEDAVGVPERTRLRSFDMGALRNSRVEGALSLRARGDAVQCQNTIA